MTDVVLTNVDGRPLSKRGLDTRRRLLDAAERVFGELGFHDASVVKVAEAAGVATGTFYLYFDTKKAVFDELVRDLNRRVRHAMKEASSQGSTRLESERLGFDAYFRFTAEHPALYRIIRQAEFVSPQTLQRAGFFMRSDSIARLASSMRAWEMTRGSGITGVTGVTGAAAHAASSLVSFGLPGPASSPPAPRNLDPV